jgi:ABC-type Mn2+/Zn2+ transport system permease subunit
MKRSAPPLPPLFCPLGLATAATAHSVLAGVALTLAIRHHHPHYFLTFACYLILAGLIAWKWYKGRRKRVRRVRRER